MTFRRTTAALMLVAALGAPATASAHGDPASDVLAVQDAYFPIFPAAEKPLRTTLSRLLAAVRRRGYPVKVALIHTRGDLGAFPELFGKPEPYAKLLESELIAHSARPHLLVVMANGMAARNLGHDADGILEGIEIDEAAESDGLVRAAIEAVAAVAAANGHPVPASELTEEDDQDAGSEHTGLLVVSGVIVMMGLLLIGLSFRLRRLERADPSHDRR